jgi:penicillin-binding protein 1C
VPRAPFALRFVVAVCAASLVVVGALGALQLAWCTPLPDAQVQVGREELRDRHGALLRDARDMRARHFRGAPPEAVRGVVGAAFVASEDRRLFEHGGVDWRAALRASWTLLRQGRVRSGASTMAMQLARIREGRSPGIDPWHKLRDVVLGWRLTASLGPEGILRAYLDEVPLGPRVVGVEAAAWRTFGKSSRALTPAEAAVLASFARAPSSAERAAVSERARGRVRWRAAGIVARMAEAGAARAVDAAAVEVVVGSLVGVRSRGVPRALEARLDREGVVRSTIDAHATASLERALRAGLDATRTRGVSHASGLLVDLATLEVRAASTVASEGDPWFDGTAARRQPGSALKPFLVALALAELGSESLVVHDAPTTFDGDDGAFEPRNYDGRFHGDVPVEDLLARSLNVPALEVASRVGAPRLLEFLHTAGFASLDRGPDHYGINLALGDGEVTLAEVAAGYAALANGGVWRSIRWDRDARLQPERRLVDADVARAVVRMLDDDARRAPTFERDGVFAAPYPLAAKTGTSRDHRDAWAVGFTRRTLVAVWMGRADAGATREVNGARGPGPVVRAVLDASEPSTEPFPTPSADRWREVRVCTGERSGVHGPCERERLGFRRVAEQGPEVAEAREAPQASRPGAWFVFPPRDARFLRSDSRAEAAQGLRVLVGGDRNTTGLTLREGSRVLPVTVGRAFAVPLVAGERRLVLEHRGHPIDERVVHVAPGP